MVAAREVEPLRIESERHQCECELNHFRLAAIDLHVPSGWVKERYQLHFRGALRVLGIFMLLAVFISILPSSAAQVLEDPQVVRLPVTGGNAMRFSRISTEDGLSQTRAAIITQDNRGFIWFGTQYGLNRYDGYNFKLYVHDAHQKNSLGGVYIASLFKDRSGALWIGCPQTLDRFDPISETFTHYAIDPGNPNGIGATVVDISQGTDGLLWLATGIGLYSMDPATGKLAHYRHHSNNDSSLSSNDIKTSGEDKSGGFWVGTSEGLDAFDRKTGKVILHVQLPELKYISFYEDRLGNFWIYHASGNGLDLLDRKKKILTHYLIGDQGSVGKGLTGVSAMLEDRLGNLWLGSRTAGVLKFDRQRLVLIQYKNSPADLDSLAEDRVVCLFADREGNIWTGLNSSGPNHFNPNQPQFEVFRHDPGNPNSLEMNLLNSIYEDHQGTLWLANDNGLIRVNQESGRYTRFSAGLGQRPIVTSIAEDHSGAIWVGTYGNGVARLDQKTKQFVTFTHNPDDPSSLSSDQVERLMFDKDGILWVATADGLSRFDSAKSQFTVYKADWQNHRGQAYNSITEDSHVFGDGLGVTAIRGAGLAAVFLPALQALFAHQAGAAPFTRAGAVLLQIHEDTWRTIRAAAGPVGRRDLRREGRVLALPRARPLLQPAVIPAG